METEQQAYEVPGQQLRWRASQLNAQGYPYQVQPAAGGIYIVIVQQPSGVNPFAYQPPPRQSWPAAGNVIWLRISIACAVGAMVCGLLYLVFSRAAFDAAPAAAAAPAAQTDSAWGWLFTDWQWPWNAEPEPPALAAATPTPGWQWPWDSAAANLRDATESAQATVTMISAGVLIVLVLLIVLALVRKGGRK